eukprot:270746-Chlamydomonas_euryale.AAC.8
MSHAGNHHAQGNNISIFGAGTMDLGTVEPHLERDIIERGAGWMDPRPHAHTDRPRAHSDSPRAHTDRLDGDGCTRTPRDVDDAGAAGCRGTVVCCHVGRQPPWYVAAAAAVAAACHNIDDGVLQVRPSWQRLEWIFGWLCGVSGPTTMFMAAVGAEFGWVVVLTPADQLA